MRAIRSLLVILTACAAALALRAGPAAAQERGALLNVPYVAQTQQLCGGAAVAMVLRYWGEQSVVAQDFAPLVDRSEGGIRTSVLVRAIAERGWQPLAAAAADDSNGDVEWMQGEINKGRPVIALVEERPRVFHYVVVVGVTSGEIVFHDPARAPYRSEPRAAFERRWEAAGRWRLVVLPGRPRPEPVAVTASAVSSGSSPCGDLVQQYVAVARTGRLDEAEPGLLAATALCPNSASAWLELGGLRFRQQRYPEAALMAQRATTITPADSYGWQLLATSLYLQGNVLGALRAWNRIDAPRADLVSVEGVQRIDHPVVIRTTGLDPRELITPGAFRRAERRLRDLPTASRATLRVVPQPAGVASIRAVIDERSVLPGGAAGWGAVGVNAAFRRELRLLLAGPFRQGETFDVRYRWAENRPRVRLNFSAPAPAPLGGVFGVEALWERQAYADSDTPLRQERRRLGVHVSDWASGRLQWQLGAAADHFGGNQQFLAAEGHLDARWRDDRVAAFVSLGYWMPTAGAAAFAVGEARTSWRSGTDPNRASWSAQTGILSTGKAAPLAIWPVAGSSESRGVLLRGHTLHRDGIIISEVLGRRIAFASAEYQRPVYRHDMASVGIAGFVDLARAWRRIVDGPSPVHVDVGAGLRITAPGAEGQLRVDVGYGLRDGETKLSAGYVMPFGR